MTNPKKSPIGLENPNYLQEILVPSIMHSMIEYVNATTGDRPNNLMMFQTAAYIMCLVTSIVSKNISGKEAADYEDIKEKLLAEVQWLSSPDLAEELKQRRKTKKKLN